jgi:hypothetical protein
MELPWNYHGITMELPWNYHRMLGGWSIDLPKNTSDGFSLRWSSPQSLWAAIRLHVPLSVEKPWGVPQGSRVLQVFWSTNAGFSWFFP